MQTVLASDRRALIGAIIVVPMLAVLGVVALLPSPPTTRTSAPTADAPAPASSAAPSDPASVPPSGARDLTAISADATASLLAAAGQSVGGDLDQAWTFRDGNGLNLMVATIETVAVSNYTMRVTLVGDAAGRPRVLARLADSGLPGCSTGLRGNGDHGNRNNERRNKGRGRDGQGPQDGGRVPPEQPPVLGSAGFTSGSVTLGDADLDGIGEVTVGWSSSCGETGAASRVQLALISAERTYAAKGLGVVGPGGGGSLVPDPDPTSWPDGYLDALTAVFHRVYY